MNTAQQLYITFTLIMLPIGGCAAIMLFKYRADFFAKLSQMPPALQACYTMVVIFPLTTTGMLVALLPFAIWGQDTGQSFLTGSLITGLYVAAINAAIQYHRSARLKALEKKIQGDLADIKAYLEKLPNCPEAAKIEVIKESQALAKMLLTTQYASRTITPSWRRNREFDPWKELKRR